MTTANRPPVHKLAGQHALDEKRISDYLRTLYKRRWVVIPVFLIFFVTGAINALRQTPIFQSRTQLLIETDSPAVASLDQMFQRQSSYMDDDFYQTQYRILQSRSLAKATIDAMKLWNAPRLGHGPAPRGTISITGTIWKAVNSAIQLARAPFAPPPPTQPKTDQAERLAETAAQSNRIDEFLSGLTVTPIRNTRLVEVSYDSTDPVFAADAANAVAKAYIQQNMEQKFSSSKEAADWLSDRLGEQRKALEASEAALQAYKEKNGTVSVADTASNIIVQRLTDLNAALTKAKTERIDKEASYHQLEAAERAGTLETFPAVMANDYIQKLRLDLADLQRQQEEMSQRYGDRNPEMIKIRSAIQSQQAKLQTELSKVVESVKNEYQAALGEEQSLQTALDQQKSAALSQNRQAIEYGVLQRDVDSNRQIYESLMQRTKETGISSELRASNVRVIDPAEVPRYPISPNLRRDLTLAFGGSLIFAIGLALVIEQFDNRIRTPQELKAHLGIPLLGLVPAAAPESGSELLLSNGVPPNFVEAIKTVRTNVIFSSAHEGTKAIVVTSAGPGEGKSTVAANLALALAQTGQRVLLVDADLRRPRVHDLFGAAQEPGLSNLLTGNAKAAEAIKKSGVSGLWLLTSGHIPPNPSELLGSNRYANFIASLNDHFDWAVIDTPPVLAVTDSSVAANGATGVVFVVGSDKTARHAAKAAVEQLEAANAHVLGGVLNNVDIARHPHYYGAYYHKNYSRYYVGHGAQ